MGGGGKGRQWYGQRAMSRTSLVRSSTADVYANWLVVHEQSTRDRTTAMMMAAFFMPS